MLAAGVMWPTTPPLASKAASLPVVVPTDVEPAELEASVDAPASDESDPSVTEPARTAATVPIPSDDCAPVFDVRFEPGRAEPIARDDTDVDAMGKWLARHPDAVVVVDGHADASGGEDLNLALSHRRARRVAAWFEAAGVDRSRMLVRGFGEYAPGAADAERNRRVAVGVRGGPTAGCRGPEERP